MTSLIREIQDQKPGVRTALWLVSTFVALSFIGFFWFTSMERTMFLALHDDPQEQAAFLARQDARSPKPLAALGKGFGSLTAAIGGMLGVERERGFDRPAQEDTVYLLPLSK